MAKPSAPEEGRLEGNRADQAGSVVPAGEQARSRPEQVRQTGRQAEVEGDRSAYWSPPVDRPACGGACRRPAIPRPRVSQPWPGFAGSGGGPGGSWVESRGFGHRGPPLRRGGSMVSRGSTCVYLAGGAGRGPRGPTGAIDSGPMGGGWEKRSPQREECDDVGSGIEPATWVFSRSPRARIRNGRKGKKAQGRASDYDSPRALARRTLISLGPCTSGGAQGPFSTPRRRSTSTTPMRSSPWSTSDRGRWIGQDGEVSKV